jgi:hypothetical protein
VVLYKWALVIPESVSIIFPENSGVRNFLGFGELEWHPLRFRLLVTDPAFVSTHNTLQGVVAL